MKGSVHQLYSPNLPSGIQRNQLLPDAELGALWDSIIIEDSIKNRLLSQAVLNFTIRRRINRTVLPLHGVILLVGPPGTGKTSLARGLAHRTAESFPDNRFRLIEVEPHSLTSSAMGKTQRAVSELFSQSIAELSVDGPMIVLLDEVETLAADRLKMSLEANPIDIHRATDAVLIQLDVLSEHNTNLLFVATSNFPQAVDKAFTSRCDLVLKIPLPDEKACLHILKDCLLGLGTAYPSIGQIVYSPKLENCASECVGLDGRVIRKAVVNALASTPQIAIDPNQMTVEHILSSIKTAKENRTSRGE